MTRRAFKAELEYPLYGQEHSVVGMGMDTPIDKQKQEHEQEQKSEIEITPLTPPKGRGAGEDLNFSKLKDRESEPPATWTDELMQAWNDYHPPELPEVTIGKVDRRRRRAIANACKLNSELNWWCRLFAALGTVPKYIGEAEGLESWKADFNWVLNHAQEAHELIECEGGCVEMEEQGCLNEEETRERKGERQHKEAIAKLNAYIIKHGGSPLQQITYEGTYSCRNCFDSGYESDPDHETGVSPCLNCDAHAKEYYQTRQTAVASQNLAS